MHESILILQECLHMRGSRRVSVRVTDISLQRILNHAHIYVALKQKVSLTSSSSLLFPYCLLLSFSPSSIASCTTVNYVCIILFRKHKYPPLFVFDHNTLLTGPENYLNLNNKFPNSTKFPNTMGSKILSLSV